MKQKRRGPRLKIDTRLPVLYTMKAFGCSDRHARRMIAEGSVRIPAGWVEVMVRAGELVGQGTDPDTVAEVFASELDKNFGAAPEED